ncbi:MAG: hypothetical protein NXI20_09900 [bacterium]|nr:hypothetical protein [bacterium]
MFKIKLTVTILFSLILFSKLNAQYTLNGFSLGDSAIVWYDDKIGQFGSEVNTGSYHQLERKSSETHAYWNSGSWQTATINYRNEIFKDVPIIYDLEKDLVLTINRSNPEFATQPIRLIRQQLDWFQVGETRFVYLPESTSNLEGGFFKLIYLGEHISFYEKMSKTLEFENRKSNYEDLSQFYIHTDKGFSKGASVSAVIKIYKERKSEIKALARLNRVTRFQKTPTSWISEFAKELNQLLSES